MTFHKPPIIEAIFLIGVQRDSDFTFDMLDPYRQSIIEQFPQVEMKIFKNIPLDFSSTNSPINIDREGYRLINSENQKVINANINNFSFNQLEPYSNWDLFFSEAYCLWEKYAEFTNVNKISNL